MTGLPACFSAGGTRSQVLARVTVKAQVWMIISCPKPYRFLSNANSALVGRRFGDFQIIEHKGRIQDNVQLVLQGLDVSDQFETATKRPGALLESFIKGGFSRRFFFQLMVR